MKMHRCCFTGHREIDPAEYESLKANLKRTILELMETRNVSSFLTGGARGFDTLAAQVVLEIREDHPEIHLLMIIPCENQTRGWPEEDAAAYADIRSRADFVKVLSTHYFRGCMHVRNRYMVDQSRHCICYQRKHTGGTTYTVDYAKQQNHNIIYL